MMCVGRYQIKSHVYKKFIEKMYTNDRLEYYELFMPLLHVESMFTL